MTDADSVPEVPEGATQLATLVCANEECPFGEDGRPKLFVPARWWQKCCSVQCRMKVATVRRRAANKLLRDAEKI